MFNVLKHIQFNVTKFYPQCANENMSSYESKGRAKRFLSFQSNKYTAYTKWPPKVSHYEELSLFIESY